MGDWALPEEKPVLLARAVPSTYNSKSISMDQTPMKGVYRTKVVLGGKTSTVLVKIVFDEIERKMKIIISL